MSTDPVVVTAAVTVVAGVAGQIVARRARVPAIAPLLLLGVLLGPGVLDVVRPQSLGQSGLRTVVGFAVAIILFEGGLSLKVESFRLAGRAIRNLVLIGSLSTWALATVAAAVFFPEIGIGPSLLFGALVIVTGPTVILPLLLVVRPRKRLADVLRGEAILIDPIGALYAVLMLELLIEYEAGGTWTVIVAFGWRVLLGFALAGVAAFALHRLIRRQDLLVPDLRNLAVLAVAIGVYALSEAIVSESGVLTVTLAGFLLGWLAPPGIEQIEEFKGHLTVLMVSVVFVLLSANLSLPDMVALGWPGAGVVAFLIFLARPITIFLSTLGTDLTLREKLFLSWIAPRGIVAASVSSLFALLLADHGRAEAGQTVMNLTFAVIAGTVLLQGPTAQFVGRALKVLEEERRGFLVVGANTVALAIARALHRADKRVVILDTNRWRVEEARKAGLRAINGDALDENLVHRLDLEGIGSLLAITQNDSVNRLAAKLYSRDFEHTRAVRLRSSPEADPKHGLPRYLFDERLTWDDLLDRLRAGDAIERAEVDEEIAVDAFDTLLPGAVPLFAFGPSGAVRFLADDAKLLVGEAVFFLAPAESAAASEGEPAASPAGAGAPLEGAPPASAS